MALVLALLRRVLEYLGWPEHQVVSVCQRKEYGPTRSVVRRLGTILSLEPCPRPYFQVNPSPLDYEQSTAPTPAVPSLGDVLWVANDEGQAFLWRKEKSTVHHDLRSSVVSIQSVPKNSTQKDSIVDQEALQKISALEDELVFLRAQIAAIVAGQTLGSVPSRKPFGLNKILVSLLLHAETFKTFSIPDGFYPVPAMTSTPLSISHNHFVIPSPPPLPSGTASGVDASISAVELIKQRRAARKSSSTTTDSADNQRTKNVPSMMDVLKDLNKVQLKAIERSPGGTPLSKPKKRRSSDWDPVALLTHALQKKFAHKNDDEDDSLDKENRSFDSSPFSSPEIPLVCFYRRIALETEVINSTVVSQVGRCSLKPSAKSSLLRTDEVKQMSTWKVKAHI
uniref:Mitochondrial fission regulator n=1 Tax=Nothoprocta perdicaria TaxID=30464 RepID=A0A8C6Z4V1_NOTPE